MTQEPNTELVRLISISGLHEDDAREVFRIFPVLTDDKKVQILDTWDSIIEKIKFHRAEMEREKEILLVHMLQDIEHDLEEYNFQQIQQSTKHEMDFFKNTL